MPSHSAGYMSIYAQSMGRCGREKEARANKCCSGPFCDAMHCARVVIGLGWFETRERGRSVESSEARRLFRVGAGVGGGGDCGGGCGTRWEKGPER